MYSKGDEMQLERLNKIIDKILVKNGTCGKYITNFQIDTIIKHLRFLSPDETVIAAVKFPISDKLTAYFITSVEHQLYDSLYDSVALFIVDDIVVDSYFALGNKDIFKPLYDAKEAYIDSLLKDFMSN